MGQNIFYDTIIFSSIFLAVFLIWWLKIKLKEKKYPAKYIKTVMIIITLAGSVIFYGSFIEPQIITVNQQNITLSKNSNKNFTIALISDIHTGPYKKSGYVKRISQKIISLNPDLILIAGDHIFGSNPEQEVQYLTPLKKMAVKIPTYAVSGNHEYNVGEYDEFGYFADSSQTVKNFYRSIGVNYLENDTTLIHKNNNAFWLLGIDDVHAGNDNLQHALKLTDNKYPKIVLVHNPDLILKEKLSDISLIMTGHTHGGQIRLPIMGPVPKIPTQLGRQYDEGLFSLINGTQLFITSGIGESGTRARLFNPPEIALLKIKL